MIGSPLCAGRRLSSIHVAYRFLYLERIDIGYEGAEMLRQDLQSLMVFDQTREGVAEVSKSPDSFHCFLRVIVHPFGGFLCISKISC